MKSSVAVRAEVCKKPRFMGLSGSVGRFVADS